MVSKSVNNVFLAVGPDRAFKDTDILAPVSDFMDDLESLVDSNRSTTRRGQNRRNTPGESCTACGRGFKGDRALAGKAVAALLTTGIGDGDASRSC